MDTIPFLWINQDQRNGERWEIKCGSELEKRNVREKKEHLCNWKRSMDGRSVLNSISVSHISAKKGKCKLFIGPVNHFILLNHLKNKPNSSCYEVVTWWFSFLIFSFFHPCIPGPEPDIHLPWHLPWKRPESSRGIHGGNAGAVHGGWEAEAETGPQERRGHWVVRTLIWPTDSELCFHGWMFHWELNVFIGTEGAVMSLAFLF